MHYPTIHKEYPTALSDWGPYSKHLAGISHIENEETGEMTDVSYHYSTYTSVFILLRVKADDNAVASYPLELEIVLEEVESIEKE